MVFYYIRIPSDRRKRCCQENVKKVFAVIRIGPVSGRLVLFYTTECRWSIGGRGFLCKRWRKGDRRFFFLMSEYFRMLPPLLSSHRKFPSMLLSHAFLRPVTGSPAPSLYRLLLTPPLLPDKESNVPGSVLQENIILYGFLLYKDSV